MLEKSVEECREKHAAVRSRCSKLSRTVILAACVMCKDQVGVTTLEDCRCRSNFCPDWGSNPHRRVTSVPEAKVLTTGPPVVPYMYLRDRGRALLHSVNLRFYIMLLILQYVLT